MLICEKVFFCNNKMESTYTLAVATILASFGKEFLSKEMGGMCKTFMDNVIIRKLILFSILYINTKDIKVSLLFVLFLSIAFNCFSDCGVSQNQCDKCGK